MPPLDQFDSSLLAGDEDLQLKLHEMLDAETTVLKPLEVRRINIIYEDVLKRLDVPNSQWSPADLKTCLDLLSGLFRKLMQLKDEAFATGTGLTTAATIDCEHLEARAVAIMRLFRAKVKRRAFIELKIDLATPLLELVLTLINTRRGGGSFHFGDAVRLYALELVHDLVLLDPDHQLAIDTSKSADVLRSPEYWHQVIRKCQRPHVALLVASFYAVLCRAGFIVSPGSEKLYHLPIPTRTPASFVPPSILHYFTRTNHDKKDELLSLDDWNMLSVPVYGWGQFDVPESSADGADATDRADDVNASQPADGVNASAPGNGANAAEPVDEESDPQPADGSNASSPLSKADPVSQEVTNDAANDLSGEELPIGFRVTATKAADGQAFLFIGRQHSLFAVLNGTQGALMPTSRLESVQSVARQDKCVSINQNAKPRV